MQKSSYETKQHFIKLQITFLQKNHVKISKNDDRYIIKNIDD